ncbi:hypothetical protein ZIOFF_070857 [Zingiber officinale]|uniref:Uncharacterized protein n=1 Tax=Zingiber officinale TaxID=94328 RepID=A0A8J5EB49_ZINOF|nr:hypothetical protein ZIOFF_070857 [Zingiber officinale]
MANDSVSRFATKIGNLFRPLAAEMIRVSLSDLAARSMPEVQRYKLEGIKVILKNIKGLLYDSGRQIREDAIKLLLKELQDLVIEVEDLVDDYQYKMFQREAEFLNKIEQPSGYVSSDPLRGLDGGAMHSPGLDGAAKSCIIDSCPGLGGGARSSIHPSPELSVGASHSSGLDVGTSHHSGITDFSSGFGGGARSTIDPSPEFSSGLGGGARSTIDPSPEFFTIDPSPDFSPELDGRRRIFGPHSSLLDQLLDQHKKIDKIISSWKKEEEVISCITTDPSSGLDGGARHSPGFREVVGPSTIRNEVDASPIKGPFNIVVRIAWVKHNLLAQLQKSQKFASHLLLVSQENQDSEKLQRVREFLLAESSSQKSTKDLNYFPADTIRGRKHYNAFDVTKQIYGRNRDKEFIISWLFSTNSRFSLFEDERSRNKFSAISIVGEAGVGKTTLAKEVYNDPLICKYFNSRVWLHFTEESDAVSFSKAFFVSITGKSCDGKLPVHLQSVMKEELKGKKLLLVLDDLQDLNPRLWEYLQAPLAGVRMAKFIITSRTELEASKLRGIESYPLGCLPLDLSWDLFQHCAFREDSSHPPKLIEIGKRIVQECRGLPIAVKTLGSVLGYQMDKQIWIDVLDSELWELQETETDISPALQLSYYLLPTYLKPCFLYCSLFLEDISLINMS